jgi:hypothetical protein
MNWFDNFNFPDSYFDKLRDTGIKAVRFPVFWSDIQPSKSPTYDFAPYDLKLQKLRDRGITPILDVYSCPDWACGPSTDAPVYTGADPVDAPPTRPAHWGGPIPPDYYDDFINFIDAMAQHYYNTPPYNSYNVHYWELWNEEDLNWDGQEYTTLMQQFYQKIKQYDPNDSVVMNGGFAYDGSQPTRDFLTSAWTAGLDNYVDVVAFHYYSGQYYNAAWNQIHDKIEDIKVLFPTDKFLYNNESGLMSETVSAPFTPCNGDPTDEHCSTPAKQARYVVQWATEGIKARAVDNLWGMSWFLMRDYANEQPFNSNGLMVQDAGYTTKLSYASMRTMLSEIGSDTYVADLGPAEGVNAPLVGIHVRPAPGVLNAHAWVVWDGDPYDTQTRPLTLPASSTQNSNYTAPNLIRVVALDGTAYPVINNSDGSKTVNIGQDPVYLEWGRFDDVPYSLWAWTYIEYLTTHGVVSGYGDYTFHPNDATLRGQFAKMIVLGLNIPISSSTQDFEDVPPGSVYFPYVEAAFHAGIIGGYPCSGPGEPCGPQNRPYFRPSNSITRGQLAKMVVLAKHWTLLNPTNPTFSDVLPGSTFYTYVETGYAHNVLAGYEDGTYRPNNVATRAQCSKLLYYAIQQP